MLIDISFFFSSSKRLLIKFWMPMESWKDRANGLWTINFFPMINVNESKQSISEIDSELKIDKELLNDYTLPIAWS